MLQVYVQSEMFYSPALLNAINELETKYPASKNLAFYRPQIEKVKKSVEMNAKEFKEAKIIKRKYSAFSRLLDEFVGTNLLVDIWATWCGPCIQDFSHKASLQPYIDSARLSVLFISIDKPAWEDRWLQSIKYNELSGNHYRGDQTFIEDMWRTLGGFEGRIPRYALVNKAGKIVVPDASRPGSDTLLKEIEQLLKE